MTRGDTVAVTVDRGRCVGSGMCVVYAPATFEHDETAKAVVVDPAGDPFEVVEGAVEACPTSALSLTVPGGPTSQKGEA